MSKLRLAVVIGLAILVSPGLALGKGGGGGGGHGGGGGGHGGGHGGFHFAGHGGGHFGHAHSGGGHFARAVHVRSFAARSFGGGRAFAANAVSARALRGAFNARGAAGALHNPAIRAALTAGAATAAWGGLRGANGGWWQHANGGFGWVGPLFWPFAYNDIYDYALWGDGYGIPFWSYGYDDIYAGVFGPYGFNDLTGYFPRYAALYPQYPSRRGRSARAEAPSDPLAAMCGTDTSDIAGLPVDQIQQLIQLTDEQRALLDKLADASAKASQTIKSACPSDMALTAPARLAVMEQRIDAMIAAVQTVQLPLQKFDDSLNDEQKAQFSALVEQQHRTSRHARTSEQPVADCGIARPGVMDWPEAQIEQRVHPTDTQKASLAALHDAAAKAADTLKECQPDSAVTSAARLEAINERLNVMLDAVKTVRAALDAFYATLTDEQKARFESIGRERVG